MANAGKEGRGGVAALLTPPGRGGVAVIWMKDGGGTWLRAHFRPVGAAAPSAVRVRVGWLVDGEERLDEVVVRERRPAEVEIHCHGGKAVSERILALAAREGVRRVAPGEVSEDLWGGGRIEREALRLLLEAETDRVARMLADQAAGALSGRLEAILSLEPGGAIEAIDRLLETAPAGIAATSPGEIRIVGLPNAGKSTLMNALLGWDRAIVFEAGGTTRDLVRERTSFGGIPVDLVDTPGLRTDAGVAEGGGIERVDRGWERGIAAIVCIDGSEPLADLGLPGRATAARDLLVITKADLPRVVEREALLGGPNPIRVSARTGEGIDDLREAIESHLAPGGLPGGGEALIFTRWLEDSLRQVREAISREDLDAAALLVRQCRGRGDRGDHGGTDG